MSSTTSTYLELELQTATENLATWGAKANTTMALLEDAIAGTTSISVTGGYRILTDTDQASNEARKAVLKVSGTLTSNQTVVIPNRSKTYSVWNATSGSYTLTIATPTTLTVSGVSGTFVVGETVTGGTSAATAIILEVTSSTILTVHTITGSFQAAETITGGTSSATATYASTSSPTTTAAVTQGATVEIYCDGNKNIWWLSPESNRTTGAPISAVSGTTAANVSFTPSGNTSATNVQDAIEELQADLDALDLSTKQAGSARLTEIAGVSPILGTVLSSTGSGWTSLGVGSNGQQLQADSAQSGGLKWATVEIDSDTKTKGRIWSATGSVYSPLTVGSNGQNLVADSTASGGVAWSTPGVTAGSITNAMLANVATKTVKGRTDSGTGDPTDLSMATLATMITGDATALATLLAALDGFSPTDDIRGTTDSGTITIPAGWTTYALLGYVKYSYGEDPVRTGYDSVWRSSVLRSVEATQTPSDYATLDPSTSHDGFLVAVKVT